MPPMSNTVSGILMISPLMVSSQNVKVSQKRCLGTSIESFTGSSPSDQIIDLVNQILGGESSLVLSNTCHTNTVSRRYY